MSWPDIKSRGTKDTKMSANADLITVEAYVMYVKEGKTIKNQFFKYGFSWFLFINVKTNLHCWLFGRPGWPLSYDMVLLASQLSSHLSIYI